MQPLTIGLVIEHKELQDEIQLCLNEYPVRVQFEESGIGDWPRFADQLVRTRPDALIFEVGSLVGELPELVARIRELGVVSMLIACHQVADPEVILASLRAGFQEFLFPPMYEGLIRALEKRSDEKERVREGSRKGRILGFLSAKGGCGATTLACHTAVEFQQLKKFEVLLADMDFDSGMISFLMKTKSTYSIQDAINNIHRLDVSFWKAIVSADKPQLEIIPAPAPVSMRQQPKPDQLQHVLRFVRQHYDWSVVDLGRNLNFLGLSVLDEIDETCLITTLDVPALHQAKNIIQTLMNTGYARNRLRLILNRVPQRLEMTPDEIEKIFGIPVFAVLTDEYQDLYDAYAGGHLLKDGKLLRQIHSFSMKLAGVQEEKKKFRLFG